MKGAPWWLAPALLLACDPRPATELVVVIDADPVVSATLAQVTVTATREGEPQSFGARTVPRDAIPGTLALVPDDADDERPVTVDVAATAADGSVLHQTVRVAFVPDETRYVSIHLVGGCRGVSCGAGQTCAGASCSDAARCASACVAQTSFGAGAAPVPAPRPLAPASTARVTTSRPTFRFQLGAGSTGAVLEICRERSCATIEQTVDVPGASGQVASARVTGALSPGVHFWRLRERAGEGTRAVTSATWEFFVGAHATEVDASVGLTGDYDGDGYADLVAGSLFGLGLRMVPGGPTGFDAARVQRFPRFANGVPAQASVAAAGDVNGDGYADLAVSRFGAPTTVLSGGPGGLSTASARALGDEDSRDYARGIGDVDGDGYADLAVAALTPTSGAVLKVYLGGARGLAATPAATVPGESVAGAGDVNGDGYADLVAFYPTGNGTRGAIDLYLGGAAGLQGSPRRVVSEAVIDSLATARGYRDFPGGFGDFNGDGYSDLVMCSHTSSLASNPQGYDLRVWSGGPGGLAATAERWTVAVAPVSVSLSVVTVGDTNADGFDDLAVVRASVLGLGGAGSSNRVEVFAGSPSGVGRSPIAALDSDRIDESPTSRVVGPGDCNGDGFADITAGTFNELGELQRVLLFPGGSSGPSPRPADAIDYEVEPGLEIARTYNPWLLARRRSRRLRVPPV